MTDDPTTSAEAIDLAARGIDRDQAADLRRRLATFVEDWLRPEMDVYDRPDPRDEAADHQP